MIEIRIRAFILECERKLTFTEAGFLSLLRVFTTPTDTPPLLALVRLWLEEVFDRFGLDQVLLILRLKDVYGWLEFWEVLRTLGLERDRRGFGFKSACVLLAGTPGDSVRTETRLLLNKGGLLEIWVLSMVDVDFVTTRTSASDSSNTMDNV
jgi:hypothetical protein